MSCCPPTGGSASLNQRIVQILKQVQDDIKLLTIFFKPLLNHIISIFKDADVLQIIFSQRWM